MSLADPITQLQEDIAALLEGDSGLALVTIEQEQKGTIQGILDRALRGVAATAPKKAGLVIVVDLPDFKVNEEDSRVLDFTVEPSLTILERPAFNRTALGTQVTAAQAVEIAGKRLHYRTLGLGTLLCLSAEPLNAGDDLVFGYTLKLAVQRSLEPEARGAMPLITFAGGSEPDEQICTLTGGGHAGETIYYTTNGNPPVPGASGVSEYSAPFAVTSGTVVRASSDADDYDLSDFTMEEAP